MTGEPRREGRSAAFPRRPGECAESFHIRCLFATITLGPPRRRSSIAPWASAVRRSADAVRAARFRAFGRWARRRRAGGGRGVHCGGGGRRIRFGRRRADDHAADLQIRGHRPGPERAYPPHPRDAAFRDVW